MSTILWLIHPSLTTMVMVNSTSVVTLPIFYTHYDSCCESLLLRYCVSQNRAQNNPTYHPRTNIRNKIEINHLKFSETIFPCWSFVSYDVQQAAFVQRAACPTAHRKGHLLPIHEEHGFEGLRHRGMHHRTVAVTLRRGHGYGHDDAPDGARDFWKKRYIQLDYIYIGNRYITLPVKHLLPQEFWYFDSFFPDVLSSPLGAASGSKGETSPSVVTCPPQKKHTQPHE